MPQSSAASASNINSLYADPAGTLAREEIRIAPQGKGVLFFGIAVLAVLFPLLIAFKLGRALSPSTYATIGIAIVAIGLIRIAFFPFGVELVLTAEGMRLRRRATEVFCPWSLFHTSGKFFVRNHDHELILPIAPRAIPFIRQYHHDCLVRQGVQLKTALLELQNGTQVVLLNQCAAPSDELGRLLLHLGRSLGGQLPAESIVAEACPAAEELEPLTQADPKGGWITVNLTRLVLPPHCCECGGAADKALTLEAGLSWIWVVAFLGHYNETVTVRIPICHQCLTAMRQRQRQGQWPGAAIGLLLGLLATVTMVAFQMDPDRTLLFFIGGAISLVGIWVGYDLGRGSGRFPVRACYSARNNTLALRFLNSDYAEAVLALSQHEGVRGPC